jgi:hypothetical protein
VKKEESRRRIAIFQAALQSTKRGKERLRANAVLLERLELLPWQSYVECRPVPDFTLNADLPAQITQDRLANR